MTLKTKMEKIINGSYKNIAGLVVQKSGKTVYENYFNGCGVDSPLHIFSVTKSIISILIGIAIDKDYIENINQKILDFFPEYSIIKGEKTIQSITIKDLLTMTAPYKYKSEPYTEYFTSHDWVKSSLDLLGGKGKIGEFRYTPIIGPDILSGILVKATGQSVLEFATEYLFIPLDIHVESTVTFHSKEEQEAFIKAKNMSGWGADPKGIHTAGWGLTLTAMDMAKIGQLYLNEGKWKEKQIVPAEWIRESTSKQAASKQWRLSFGYLWWIIDEKEHSYAAMGDGGNIIYVNEKKELVISIASLYVPQAKDRIKLIKEYIEPVFENFIK